MQISCKCLNFIATSKGQAVTVGGIAVTADATNEACSMPLVAQVAGRNNAASTANHNNVSAALLQAFIARYPRTFTFHAQCTDFFKQTIGPISDLIINTLSQRDLIYSLTLDVSANQSWQLSICINCNVVLCAKRLPVMGIAPTALIMGANGSSSAAGNSSPPIHPPQFLINSALLTSNEELAQRRADKSYSDTFGLLIMDHPQLSVQHQQQQQQQQNGVSPTAPNLMVGSLSNNSLMSLDPKQQRLRQLQLHMQQRLQREIAETNERIQRYTEQQFALLNSFREKSEQEYKFLTRLIQRVPEQQAFEWLDRTPPALEVSGVGIGSYAARRRNTISSRRDMNSTAPTTPTTPNAPNNATMLTLPLTTAVATPITTSAMDTYTQGTANVAATAPAVTAPATPAAATVLAATIVSSNNVNRKVSNFETPPATPEATPMSVGNSPTFRQQQQQQQLPQQFVRIAANSFQQQFPTPTAEVADDCLFELEGVDGNTTTTANSHMHFQRALSNHHHQHHQNMSDLDESEDDTEKAEVALDLESTMPIPMQIRGGIAAQRRSATATAALDINFAKSLPIAIENSPMNTRGYVAELEEDELENNVDIAASIKALARSVHGEAVFGDLPPPRMRSQI